MPHPFPQVPPPDPARTARTKIRSLPALPWGEALIMLTIGLLLLQI